MDLMKECESVICLPLLDGINMEIGKFGWVSSLDLLI